MTYTIGEAAALTGISVSALRYYDREGMFPGMRRTAGGSRIFSEQELSTLRVIHCLKIGGDVGEGDPGVPPLVPGGGRLPRKAGGDVPHPAAGRWRRR